MSCETGKTHIVGICHVCLCIYRVQILISAYRGKDVLNFVGSIAVLG